MTEFRHYSSLKGDCYLFRRGHRNSYRSTRYYEPKMFTNGGNGGIGFWLEDANFTLVEHNTGVFLKTKRKKGTLIKIGVCEKPIYLQPGILANEGRHVRGYHTYPHQMALAESIYEFGICGPLCNEIFRVECERRSSYWGSVIIREFNGLYFSFRDNLEPTGKKYEGPTIF